MAESDYEGGDSKETQWLLAPVICLVVLTAGLVAGVVSALRQSGRVELGGFPLPNCQWLTSRGAVRVTAWGALIAGLFGQLTALRRFIIGWYDRAPFYLTILTLLAYSLLGTAVSLAALGLHWKQRAPKVHEALRQAAKASLLGGLAAGLAAEVLCNAGESEENVPRDWRVGCAMLGASSGLLLLGLLAAQVDGQARMPPPIEHQISITDDVGGVEEDRGLEPPCRHMRINSYVSETSLNTQESQPPQKSSLWSSRSWPSWSSRNRETGENMDWQHLPLQPRALPPQSDLSNLRAPLLLPSPASFRWKQSRPQPQAMHFGSAATFSAGIGRAPPLERCGGSFGGGLLATPALMVR